MLAGGAALGLLALAPLAGHGGSAAAAASQASGQSVCSSPAGMPRNFDWPQMSGYRTGLLAEFAVVNRRIGRVAFRPVWREEADNRPSVAEIGSVQGRQIVERVTELSAELATRFTRTGDEVVVWEGDSPG